MRERQIVIRGGRLLDIPAGSCDEADIVIDGDTITRVGSPGMPARDDATVVDAGGKILHAGLINAHTHCHGNLAKGMKDKWTLEILQVLGPHLMGHRSVGDHYLSTMIGAAEMVLKGCTACYDLFLEIPTITEDGIDAVCRAYKDVGMRAVVAPSVNDMSIYSVIPGLLDALPPGIKSEVEKTPNAFESSLKAVEAVLQSWSFDRTAIKPALSPIIPLHLSAEAMTRCRDLARDYDIGIHTHLCEVENSSCHRVQPAWEEPDGSSRRRRNPYGQVHGCTLACGSTMTTSSALPTTVALSHTTREATCGSAAESPTCDPCSIAASKLASGPIRPCVPTT